MKVEKSFRPGHWPIAAHLAIWVLAAGALVVALPILEPPAMHTRLWAHGLVALGVLGLLGVIACWFGYCFKQPIVDLNRATREVTNGRYSTRVPRRECPCELARLTEEFNLMLEKLQRTESELQEAKARLEERVAIRTAELAAANKEL